MSYAPFTGMRKTTKTGLNWLLPFGNVAVPTITNMFQFDGRVGVGGITAYNTTQTSIPAATEQINNIIVLYDGTNIKATGSTNNLVFNSNGGNTATVEGHTLFSSGIAAFQLQSPGGVPSATAGNNVQRVQTPAANVVNLSTASVISPAHILVPTSSVTNYISIFVNSYNTTADLDCTYTVEIYWMPIDAGATVTAV